MYSDKNFLFHNLHSLFKVKIQSFCEHLLYNTNHIFHLVREIGIIVVYFIFYIQIVNIIVAVLPIVPEYEIRWISHDLNSSSLDSIHP